MTTARRNLRLLAPYLAIAAAFGGLEALSSEREVAGPTDAPQPTPEQAAALAEHWRKVRQERKAAAHRKRYPNKGNP